MRHLLDLSPDALQAWVIQQDQPRYRAAQIGQWLFERRAQTFEEMTDLPKSLRQRLAAEFILWTSQIAIHKQADDGTEKLLLELADQQRIECVLLRQTDLRRTICISTQVGCAMGCVFCASGLDGVVRNLTTGEIIEQMLLLTRLLPPEERLSHVVVMGMGEPLANLDHLLPALAQATNPKGLGISPRRVTISTVGLPKGMQRLAEENHPFHLAVSLHAPDDELRNRLVPVNQQIGIDAILAAADEYFRVSGRRLTFEYVLLGGINDSPEQAHRLAERLAGKTALLNVIPYNPVAGLPYQTPSLRAQERFTGILEEAGIAIKVRRRKGDQIDAACGQLRRSQPATL
jgi:23S rRNA (adenine2503-C2)-methyltransferase